MADATPTPSAPPAPIPTDPALLAEYQADNRQDNAVDVEQLQLSRDAQDRADARTRLHADAFEDAWGSDALFVRDILCAIAGSSLPTEQIEARAVAVMAMRRRLLFNLGEPFIDPLPAIDPIKVPLPMPPTSSPPDAPLNGAPLNLSSEQAKRYLSLYAEEFGRAGIADWQGAAKHWAENGRKEWLRGERTRFVP